MTGKKKLNFDTIRPYKIFDSEYPEGIQGKRKKEKIYENAISLPLRELYHRIQNEVYSWPNEQRKGFNGVFLITKFATKPAVKKDIINFGEFYQTISSIFDTNNRISYIYYYFKNILNFKIENHIALYFHKNTLYVGIKDIKEDFFIEKYRESILKYYDEKNRELFIPLEISLELIKRFYPDFTPKLTYSKFPIETLNLKPHF